MKKQNLKENLFKKICLEDLSTFAADCLEGTLKKNTIPVFAVKEVTRTDGNITLPKLQLVCCIDYDKWYQTRDNTQNCKMTGWFNDKNSVDIIIRRGQRVANKGISELQIIHGKVVPADISIYGTEMYIIHMIPGKNGEPTTIETKHYKDISPIYDSYLKLSVEQETTNLNTEPKIRNSNVKVAKYWFEACLTQDIDYCYDELARYDISPDEVRVNNVKPGEETIAINRIVKDPFAVIRRFEQIEESKKENGPKLTKKSNKRNN